MRRRSCLQDKVMKEIIYIYQNQSRRQSFVSALLTVEEFSREETILAAGLSNVSHKNVLSPEPKVCAKFQLNRYRNSNFDLLLSNFKCLLNQTT